MSLKLWFKRALPLNSCGLGSGTQPPCKYKWVLPCSSTIPRLSLIQVSSSSRSRKCVPEIWIPCRYKWLPAERDILILSCSHRTPHLNQEGRKQLRVHPCLDDAWDDIALAGTLRSWHWASNTTAGDQASEKAHKEFFIMFLLPDSYPGLWLFWVIL